MRNKILEALLYIQGVKGLTLEQIKDVFALNNIQEAKKVIKDFTSWFNSLDRALKVVNYNEIYKFATRDQEELKDAIERLANIKKRVKLTNAALEVVGIIAYKNPISRSEVNRLRGADSSSIISSLISKGLIEEVGEAMSVGKPTLLGVTNKFYDYFNIKSISELPILQEFEFENQQEDGEFDLFTSQRQDKIK
ncbi:SMC-Scp complex subunit ScpB [Mycoplasma phocimorsus]|uniref:SMC-Scp complex subunit ScpB n=1 Tax=Mycoplasma phocimorsus TaxID=3045839 RepID=A0AAJ1PRI1_9MOLU|nr:SMC-Scp complex subunit ScpB [Mycoplasma phocimorsus]MDJ1646009.1 SMC-Scp complex subunit ScpB [Mycoplasma phocimorsus]MDJ1646289.1 SMC-Scp complex subunit ScpB [Mycoplasma phocimorsus]MDJ1646893.1 SMC-Scp complex subunit ScpB [Mycoplasma phocimorsus]MDJ1647860.1 SMC-Scp complex subunit ScpB [Mycoplasma phocimorsus]MDJ1648439.1 SMC-Scp complex subunit ScpB [Mycoplasma phocimorsus]